MKLKYLFFSLVAVAVLASCNRDDQGLFDQSALERVNTYMDTVSNILVSSESGWEMLYFPNEYSGGQVILVDFNEHGQVKAAAKNSVTTDGKYEEDAHSTWCMKADQGPVLSFDTYNRVIHAFSDPMTDGEGFQGDYEFLVLKYSSTQIRMKGKKRGAYIILNRLSASQDWQSYFADIDRLNAMVFKNNNGSEYAFMDNGTKRLMTFNDNLFSEKLENSAEDYAYWPMIITPTGFHFYDKGIKLNNKARALNFVLSADKTELTCTDGQNAKFVAATTATQFFNKQLQEGLIWNLEMDGGNDSTKAACQDMISTLSATGAKLIKIAYQMTDGRMYIYVHYTIDNRHFEGMIYVASTEIANGLELSYAGADTNGKAFLRRLGNSSLDLGIEKMSKMLLGSYTMTSATGSPLNNSSIFLTNGQYQSLITLVD